MGESSILRRSSSQHQIQDAMELQELMVEVLTIQKDGDTTIQAVSRVKDIVNKSKTIVEQEQVGASEMVIDGKILSAGGHILKHHVQGFDTNLNRFIPEEYTSGILAYVESHSLQSTCDWDALSSVTYTMFKKVPPLHYRLGTFKLDPPPKLVKEKIQRQKAHEEVKKTIAAVRVTDNKSTEPTDEIYQHILRCLIAEYRKNERNPVNYLKFVIDPTDFWKSVQNVFHFSFLVRDGKVKMMINDQGLPFVEPSLSKKEGSSSDSSHVNRQFNFRLTPYEYRKLVDTFEITQPSITPFRGN